MPQIDFISELHTRTRRDYVSRVTEYPKARASKIAKQFGYDYWDGDRKFGYGGMHYDGRWRRVAEAMATHYNLKRGDRILDVGCGKAFLLYELTQAVPDVHVWGVDLSAYGIFHAKAEVRSRLSRVNATNLPFASGYFDLVICINTLHNLYCYDLHKALGEIERVGRRHKYLAVESYRNEEEKANLLYWQLTCESFYTPAEWKWWFDLCGYKGDYSLVFFE